MERINRNLHLNLLRHVLWNYVLYGVRINRNLFLNLMELCLIWYTNH